jgi:hypothetical protein
MMNKRGWTIQQIDEMDAHFLFDILEYQEEMSNPAKRRKKAWENAKVVPIDQVF